MRMIRVGDVCRVRCDPTADQPLPVTELSIVQVIAKDENLVTFPYGCVLLFGERICTTSLNFSLQELEIINEQENHRELPDDSDRVE